MRYPTIAVVTSLAIVIVNGSPVAQSKGIDFGAYEDAAAQLKPDVTPPAGLVAKIIPFNPSSVISSAIAGATGSDFEKRKLHKKRGTCQPYPVGTGPTVSNPDTPATFEDFPQFSSDALNAIAPAGYELTPGFQNLNGSASAGNYMGVNSSITSYDPSQCSSQCDDIEGCVSFNIYYERDPTIDADANNCPNPASLTRIKCSFWGLPVRPSDATNYGQYQAQFQVVIAGSNAYDNTPAPATNFTGPVSLGGAIIQTPSGDTSYMGVQSFPNSPYNPQYCVDACQAKSAYNIQQGYPSASNPQICTFFDSYVLLKNDNNPVFTCTYYSQAWDASYATNKGQYDGDGNHFTITKSYTYALSIGQ